VPSKHIDDVTWRKVEKETVEAVVATRESLKDTEILKLLILKGLENITEEDYINYANKKKRR
jgi:hypothetical protein